MDNNRLPSIHPGEILRLDFLDPLEITPYRLSKDLGVPQTRMGEILAGRRSVTADMALRLSRYFGNSAEFWLNLQSYYDLERAREQNAEVYERIPAAPLVPVV
jgi:antitoxin HigA-1